MTSTGTQQARQFLAAVEQACADLDPADRSRLLGGLEEHLAELSADGVDLVSELGDPAAYARELRSAAGLPTGTLPAVASGVGAGVGPATRSLPVAPPTAALPLGAGAGDAHPSAAVGAGVASGPSATKVLLVVGGVLAFVVVMVLAALVLGAGLFLGGSSQTGPAPDPVMATATQLPQPATVAVPDVTGMDVTQARTVLEAVGLVYGTEQSVTSDVEKGRVVRQDPAAGTFVGAGSTVSLVVSAGA